MQTNGTKAQSRVTAIKIQRRIIYSSYRNFSRARRSNRFNGKLHEIINIHTRECLFYGAQFLKIHILRSQLISFSGFLYLSLSFIISRQKIALSNFALTPFFFFPLLLILFYFFLPLSFSFSLILPLLS